MKIIVGLGNPGCRYEATRHNVGFRAVDRLAERQRIPVSQKRYKALYGTGSIRSQKVVLVKPLTFMNLSGEAVKRILLSFPAAPEDLIVIHDDLDLPLGKLRIKRRSGDGGHQGVRSIIDVMGENTFSRLKIGIGRPPRGMEAADYVLGCFEADEEPEIESVLSRAAEALVILVSEGVEAAQKELQKSKSQIASRFIPEI